MPDLITKEEFKSRLDALLDSDNFDPEATHEDVDDLLMDVLESLGYDVSRNRDMDWWYG